MSRQNSNIWGKSLQHATQASHWSWIPSQNESNAHLVSYQGTDSIKLKWKVTQQSYQTGKLNQWMKLGNIFKNISNRTTRLDVTSFRHI